MKNKIAALIIDPLKEEHDYSKVKVTKEWDSYEDGFDITVLKNTKDILSHLNKNRGIDCIITVGENIDYNPLNALSFEYRRKWIHMDEFNADNMAYSIINVFAGNVDRYIPDEVKSFSIFTPMYKTPQKDIERLYTSLCNQTYPNWNWFILDDSGDNYNAVTNALRRLEDPRIIVIKNISNHGSIGFNKHTIAMMCNGDYLVEVDHDDELLPHCLEKLKEAFDTYPDTDFVYSHSLEDLGGKSVWYGDDWGKNGWGGGYRNFKIKGVEYNLPVTADITPISIRTIYTQPNHVRCWRKDFYHKIGGHNMEFSILDDADILIRTFLKGKMTKVDDVLYIQHEEAGRGDGSTNTQNVRFKEIQRTTQTLKSVYDKKIHDRIEELGYKDTAWEEGGYSNLHKEQDENIPIMNNILK